MLAGEFSAEKTGTVTFNRVSSLDCIDTFGDLTLFQTHTDAEKDARDDKLAPVLHQT